MTLNIRQRAALMLLVSSMPERKLSLRKVVRAQKALLDLMGRLERLDIRPDDPAVDARELLLAIIEEL